MPFSVFAKVLVYFNQTFIVQNIQTREKLLPTRDRTAFGVHDNHEKIIQKDSSKSEDIDDFFLECSFGGTKNIQKKCWCTR